MTDYKYTTGNDYKLIHLNLIARGGFGEVHRVRILSFELDADVIDFRCLMIEQGGYKESSVRS